MSFRQFGGLNYAPRHNIVGSNYNTINNLQVTQNIGQPNSYINFVSDISGNIVINGNISGYYMFLTSGTNYNYSANAVVPKSYVDSVGAGYEPKPPCVCATSYDTNTGIYEVIGTGSDTSVIYIPGTYQTSDGSFINLNTDVIIDGYTLEDGDTILVKNQGIPSENFQSVQNGCYVYNSQENTLTRTSSMAYNSYVATALMAVYYGETNAFTEWFQTLGTKSSPQHIGFDPLGFSIFQTIPLVVGQGLLLNQVNGKTQLSVNPDLNFLTNVDSTTAGTLAIGTTNAATINFGKTGGNNYFYGNSSFESFGSINSPPIVAIDVTSGSTTINFTWTIPSVIDSSDSLSLQQLSAVLYASINGTIKAYSIINNLTTNLDTLTTITISNFASETNGVNTAGTAYFYYNSDFNSLISDTDNNKLILWYSNFNPYPNISSIGYTSFSESFPPSIVEFGTATQDDYNSITLKCYVEYTDATNSQKGPPYLTNFNIPIGDYSITTVSGKRYPNGLPFTSTAALSQSCVSNTGAYPTITNFKITGIYPDSTYGFQVEASNDNGSNYGPLGSYTFTTELPTAPSNSFPNTLFDSTGKIYQNTYATNGYYVISVDEKITNDLININLITSNWNSSTYTGPVQDSSEAGGQGTNYLTMEATIDDNLPTDISLIIGGFGQSSSYTGNNNNGITLNVTTSDYYASSSNYNQGFFLQYSTSAVISPSYFNSFITYPYDSMLTFELDNSKNSSVTNMGSYSFYIDNINSNPTYGSISTFSMNPNSDNNYYSSQVSGIYVVNSSPTFTVTGLTLNNMGQSFYASPIVQYTFSGGVSSTANSQENDLTNVTTSSGTFTIANSSIPSTILSTYNTSIALSINFNNIYGNNTTSNISPQFNVIVDVPSVTLANSITTLNTLSTTSIIGYRVWSANTDSTMSPTGIVPYVFITTGETLPSGSQAGSDEGYVNIKYDNDWNISTNQYANQELLIANGYFTTNHSYYLDYETYNKNGNLNNGIDYSGLSETRYAPFAWTSNSTTQYPFLNFQILFNGQIYTDPLTNIFYFDTGYTQQLSLYYRFEYNTDVTSNSWGTVSGITYPNTTWISINSQPGGSANQTININTICNFSNAKTVYWNTNSSVFSNNTLTVKTDCPVISLQKATLYLRIGLPDSCSTGFSTVKCNFSSN